MNDGSIGIPKLSRERLLVIVLGLLTLLALWVCYLIVEPFVPAVAVAIAVAVATRRPHEWLCRRLGSRTAAAALSLAMVTCLIVLPIGLLLKYVVQEVIQTLQQMEAGQGLPDWRSVLTAPAFLRDALEWVEANLDLKAQLARAGQNLAGKAAALLAGSVTVVTQLVITLFVLFFVYRDGSRALETLRQHLPLTNQEADRMLRRIEDTILATVNGSLTVALVQATLAGAMYTFLRVPASAIWASATFFFALVPMMGTAMVWVPIVIYLLIVGSWVKALVLLGWGVLVVGSIDNILYPYLVGGRLRLHTVPTFFSVVGGIALFGPAGLILGPVAIAITLALLDVWLMRTTPAPTTPIQ